VSTAQRHASLQSNPAEGTLRRADGARLAVVPVELLVALHHHLFDQFSEESQDLLYRSGFEQGLQDMVRLNQELREQYGSGTFDLWQMDAKFILDTWWDTLSQAGWGSCSFDLAAFARGVVVVELDASPVAAALGRTDHPICHFFAGLFAGVISFFERAERHATEIECRAAGGATCRFLVANGGDVDSAEGWRQQGMPAAEIIRRLR
jgi:predicted hydrocarbon binding protein